MKIEVEVLGPSEKLKGVFIAKGKASGKDCSVLLANKGNKVALVCHSKELSKVGNGIVISWSGETIAKGKLAPGEIIVFDNVNANVRPVVASSESNEERIARLEADNKDMKAMLVDTIALLEQFKPAAPAPAEEASEKSENPTQS